MKRLIMLKKTLENKFLILNLNIFYIDITNRFQKTNVKVSRKSSLTLQMTFS
jgi:hypothetical protein